MTAEGLRAGTPSLIVLSVTPFGLDGPWADWVSSDLVGLALGSPLNSCGYDDHSIPPIRPGGDQGYQSAASFALMGLMLALIERQATGLRPAGRRRDARLSGRERRAGQPVLVLSAGGRAPPDLPPRPADPYPGRPSSSAATTDGSTSSSSSPSRRRGTPCSTGSTARVWPSTCSTRSTTTPGFVKRNFGHIQEIIETFFLLQTADEAYHEGQARGLAVGPINSPDDLLDDEHLRARDFFVLVEHDDVPPGAVSRCALPLLRCANRSDAAGAEARRAHRRGPRLDDREPSSAPAPSGNE